MATNPVLKKLGLGEGDRAVIFHADDIGSSQASLAAYRELLDSGFPLAASTMVPCPWFPATADFCVGEQQSGRGARVDMGVHLTLTSEWSACRWGPISTRDASSGLLDEEGYFHSGNPEVQSRAQNQAVLGEIRAQIERALAAGIEVTHIDSHMLTLFHPRFLPLYFEVARQFDLPTFMVRPDAKRLQAEGYDRATAEQLAGFVQKMEEDGVLLFDDVRVLSLVESDGRLDHARRELETLPPGLSYFIIHPAQDTPELRGMASDWPSRVADFQLFMSDEWRAAVGDSGVQMIGFRALRDLQRGA